MGRVLRNKSRTENVGPTSKDKSDGRKKRSVQTKRVALTDKTNAAKDCELGDMASNYSPASKSKPASKKTGRVTNMKPVLEMDLPQTINEVKQTDLSASCSIPEEASSNKQADCNSSHDLSTTHDLVTPGCQDSPSVKCTPITNSEVGNAPTKAMNASQSSKTLPLKQISDRSNVKLIGNSSQIIPENLPQHSESNNHKTDRVVDEPHIPVYQKPKQRKSSPKVDSTEVRIHMYDFEVDENEPQIKRRKKRKVQKIKLIRPKKCTLPRSLKELKERKQILMQNEAVNKKLKDIACKLTPVEPDSACKFTPVEPDSACKFTPVDPDSACKFTPVEPDDCLSILNSSHSPVCDVLEPVNSKPSLKKTNVSVYPDIPIIFEKNSSLNNQSLVDENNDPPRKEMGTYHNESNVFFEHSSGITDYHTASTPVKHNSFNLTTSSYSGNEVDISKFNTNNCFGFDEPESLEEPLVSPIKDPNNVPAISPRENEMEKEVDSVPVRNIIQMLKFGEDVSISLTSEQKDNSEILLNFLNDDSPSINNMSMEVEPSFRAPPRRSYERPFKPRRQDSSGEESDEEARVKVYRSKKKNAPSKKEQLELEKWASKFNSQCKEVDAFDLLVE